MKALLLGARIRCKHHQQGAALKGRGLFDHRNILKFFCDHFQPVSGYFRVIPFTAAETDAHFNFFALFEPTASILDFEALVVFASLWAQANFFDLDLLLRPAGFFIFFLPLVKELAVIDDAADRWIGLRGYFDKIEVGFVGFVHSLLNRHDTDIVPVCVNETDFTGTNFFICPIV